MKLQELESKTKGKDISVVSESEWLGCPTGLIEARKRAGAIARPGKRASPPAAPGQGREKEYVFAGPDGKRNPSRTCSMAEVS